MATARFFEAVDAAFDRVALAIVDLVELRRATAARAELLAVADVVDLVRDGAADAATPQVGTVLAGGVRLVGADPVRACTRSAWSGTGDADLLQDRLELRESPRCPAVMTIDMGFWPCSTARCSFVVRPPRERPSPWSSGSMATPPGGSFCRAPFSALRRHAGGPGRRWSRR